MSWIARWWPALLWAIVISSFSTGLFTSDNTGHIIIPILHWIFPHASAHALARMHHDIRKCGHFTEYFILSILILRAIRSGQEGTRLAWAAIAVLMVAGYAAIDEFHQSFVPGRTPAVGDVLIDMSGGVAAQLIIALLFLWAHVRKKQAAEVAESLHQKQKTPS